MQADSVQVPNPINAMFAGLAESLAHALGFLTLPLPAVVDAAVVSPLPGRWTQPAA
jgi:hypothetical protein